MPVSCLKKVRRTGEDSHPRGRRGISAFNVIGPLISVLRSGEIMLFDEIDASLHPKPSARLLELFRDPQANPRGAQLIFTTTTRRYHRVSTIGGAHWGRLTRQNGWP